MGDIAFLDERSGSFSVSGIVEILELNRNGTFIVSVKVVNVLRTKDPDFPNGITSCFVRRVYKKHLRPVSALERILYV